MYKHDQYGPSKQSLQTDRLAHAATICNYKLYLKSYYAVIVRKYVRSV